MVASTIMQPQLLCVHFRDVCKGARVFVCVSAECSGQAFPQRGEERQTESGMQTDKWTEIEREPSYIKAGSLKTDTVIYFTSSSKV